jgi:hypothetical protein
LEAALGLIGMVLFIVAVIGLAAAVTYAIVKISPSSRRGKEKAPSTAKPS